MNTKISEESIMKAYLNADNAGKKLITDLFGSIELGSITDRVKTFQDAMGILMPTKTDQENFNSFLKTIPEHFLKVGTAFFKAAIITEALNEGWQPNWHDANEQKWWPWFKMSAGFGFSFSYYSYACARTTAGSRLCFKTKDLADYAGKQFESIYKDLLTC